MKDSNGKEMSVVDMCGLVFVVLMMVLSVLFVGFVIAALILEAYI